MGYIQFILLLLQVHAVFCNTEKIIFLGPSEVHIPVEHPTLEDLKLETLSPQQWSLRTHIRAEFPTKSSKYGQASWYLLHGLQEGQRYEVRVCWAATQPTDFRLDAYTLQAVFNTPELVTSLAQYLEGRQPDPVELEDQEPGITKWSAKSLESTLFLQVLAAADYYTMNKTLMEHVPPVYADIILDPYFLNVFPRSLVPTAVYIVLLAIGSWYLAKCISKWFQTFAQHSNDKKKKKS
ncbi:uncharacterized protein K444DRAFT_66571 [Hyaloscypha bicolor E]|uniref:Uncharacterized protein n=1 Tax=Hyaloscypha bicolor E TaxID=1095630 RepID=A0A2J6T0F8_9HELO|nr:uncharacterized protein K444DRAFT_66571 [Hyaloscypha bicolor E]PMD56520.1 hypothetical protein K444DRAFT_66571 [Hyaloscypha bicolor E]